MVYLELMRTDIISASVLYKKPKQDSIEVESNYKFSVDYSKNYEECVAHLEQYLRERGDNPTISIEVSMDGIFSCEGIDSIESKKSAHILAYQQLFPHIQSKILQLAASLGMPPVLVPQVKMTPEQVITTPPES